MAKKHEFSHSTVHHHKDGSHTVMHHHRKDPEKSMEYAVPDHDGMMDGMQSNLGGGPMGAAEPEPGAAGGAPEPGAAV